MFNLLLSYVSLKITWRLFRVKKQYMSVNSISTFVFIFVMTKALLLKGTTTSGILTYLLPGLHIFPAIQWLPPAF